MKNLKYITKEEEAYDLLELVQDSLQMVSLVNLQRLLLAVENIFVMEMKPSQDLASQHPNLQIQNKPFGIMINGVYYITSEIETKKIS